MNTHHELPDEFAGGQLDGGMPMASLMKMQAIAEIPDSLKQRLSELEKNMRQAAEPFKEISEKVDKASERLRKIADSLPMESFASLNETLSALPLKSLDIPSFTTPHISYGTVPIPQVQHTVAYPELHRSQLDSGTAEGEGRKEEDSVWKRVLVWAKGVFASAIGGAIGNILAKLLTG